MLIHLPSRLSYRFRLRSGACVNAEAATDLTDLEDCLLLNSFDAVDATLRDVFSLLAIIEPPSGMAVKQKSHDPRYSKKLLLYLDPMAIIASGVNIGWKPYLL